MVLLMFLLIAHQTTHITCPHPLTNAPLQWGLIPPMSMATTPPPIRPMTTTVSSNPAITLCPIYNIFYSSIRISPGSLPTIFHFSTLITYAGSSAMGGACFAKNFWWPIPPLSLRILAAPTTTMPTWWWKYSISAVIRFPTCLGAGRGIHSRYTPHY